MYFKKLGGIMSKDLKNHKIENKNKSEYRKFTNKNQK